MLEAPNNELCELHEQRLYSGREFEARTETADQLCVSPRGEQRQETSAE